MTLNIAKIIIDTDIDYYIKEHFVECKKAEIVFDNQEKFDLYKYQENIKIDIMKIILDGEEIVFDIQKEKNDKILKGLANFFSNIKYNNNNLECTSSISYILNKDMKSIMNIFYNYPINKELYPGQMIRIQTDANPNKGHSGLVLNEEYILSKIGSGPFSINHIDELFDAYESSNNNYNCLPLSFILDSVSNDFNVNHFKKNLCSYY